MSRVLIWKRVFPESEYDIFNPTDYANLYAHVQKNWHGQCQNWGNKLWFQGIYSAIDTGENEYGFIGQSIDIDQINSDYDFIVLPMANIFYQGFLTLMQELALHLEKIRIPIYVVACGVQADSYDALNDLISSIGPDSKRFIKAVYNTGGEFALRGFFTKEFFTRLGFDSAVITGCPSMYQLGPDFHVTTEKVDLGSICPVFNGQMCYVSSLLLRDSNSIYLDQDQFLKPLFQPDYLTNTNLKFQLKFIDYYGFAAAQLMAEGRIVMIADMNAWWNYLQDGEFNYAFGSRIHGTIMSLLSGVPATIIAVDSRTREMAEFFDIPMVNGEKGHCFTQSDLLECYQAMDYTAFNAGFRHRFEAYEKFLVDHGIVSRVNTENRFFVRGGDKSFEPIINSKKAGFELFAKKLKKNGPVLHSAQFCRKIKRRFFE